MLDRRFNSFGGDQVDARELTEGQKLLLLNIAKRLRRQADRLEWLAHSGDSKKLSEACGMLHATETQLLWVRNTSKAEKS